MAHGPWSIAKEICKDPEIHLNKKRLYQVFDTASYFTMDYVLWTISHEP